jgi:hypothetical protein
MTQFQLVAVDDPIDGVKCFQSPYKISVLDQTAFIEGQRKQRLAGTQQGAGDHSIRSSSLSILSTL